MSGDESLLGEVLGAQSAARQGVCQPDDFSELSAIEALERLMSDVQDLLVPRDRFGLGFCGHDFTRIGSSAGLPEVLVNLFALMCV